MYTVIHTAQHITTFFWDDVVNSRLRVYSHATSAVRLNSGTAMLELNTNSGMATEGKVSGSPKWLEFILRGAWMSGPNFHPIVLFFISVWSKALDSPSNQHLAAVQPPQTAYGQWIWASFSPFQCSSSGCSKYWSHFSKTLVQASWS